MGGKKEDTIKEAHYIYLCILYILFGQICFLSLPEAELEKNNQTFWCATSVLFFGNWKTPNISSWNSWRENVLRRGNLLKVLAITHNYMNTGRNTKEEDERFILQVTQFFFSISLIEINQNKQFLLVSCGCKSEINPFFLPPHPQVGKCNSTGLWQIIIHHLQQLAPFWPRLDFYKRRKLPLVYATGLSLNYVHDDFHCKGNIFKWVSLSMRSAQHLHSLAG